MVMPSRQEFIMVPAKFLLHHYTMSQKVTNQFYFKLNTFYTTKKLHTQYTHIKYVIKV